MSLTGQPGRYIGFSGPRQARSPFGRVRVLHVVLWWLSADGVFVTFPHANPKDAIRLGPGVLDEEGVALVIQIHALQDGALLEEEGEAGGLRFES